MKPTYQLRALLNKNKRNLVIDSIKWGLHCWRKGHITIKEAISHVDSTFKIVAFKAD